MSVKPEFFRHPGVVAAGGAALAALVAANVVAFMRGLDSPWLPGVVILTDMAVVTLSVAGALWSVVAWGHRRDLSEARLDAIVDSAMDAIITMDAAQRVVLFNRAAEQMFGVRRAEALGSPLDRFLPTRFRAAHRGHVEKFGRTGVTSRRMGEQTTLWAMRTGGEEFPIEASISQAGEPGRHFYTVILRDVTARLRSDETMLAQQRELRELSARVLEAREEEKTRIARELHDEFGQLLTALKMDLAWLRERLPREDGELAARAGSMGELIDRTVTSSRRLAADLRPLMLDDLGLPDATQWLTEEFGKRSGVRLEYRAGEQDGIDALEKGAATAVYRAIQESLTNIARHAGARNGWVLLTRENGDVRVEIEDDGRGIAPEDLAKAGSLGLKGMRERVAYYGGTLEIERAPRGGTRVRLRMPLRGGGGERA
jgi:PAS domain S-box-containing protein